LGSRIRPRYWTRSVSSCTITEPADSPTKPATVARHGVPRKLAACAESVSRGVRAAHIIDGRQPHNLMLELFTDEGIGTKITAR
jgi:acetylglutamate kinase